MAAEDPFDTSDMYTARHHLKRLLSDWRDAGGDTDVLVRFFEGFVACKVSEMMRNREAYVAEQARAAVETSAKQCLCTPINEPQAHGMSVHSDCPLHGYLLVRNDSGT